MTRRLSPAPPAPRAAALVRDERGAVTIVVAGLMVPLLLLAAFTMDVGMAYAQAQAYGSGADSAALAIVDTKRKAILANPALPTTCAQIVAADALTNQARTIATAQANRNGPYGLGTTTGVSVAVTLSCVNAAGNPSATGMLRASVTVRRDVPTTLGRLAGVSSVRASKSSAAALTVIDNPTGVFPLAICKGQADAIKLGALVQPYPAVTMDFDKVWNPGCDVGGGSGGSGNWGWLECGEDGAKNGKGVPGLADSIADGCKGVDFSLAGSPPRVTLDGLSGNKLNSRNVTDALDAQLAGGPKNFTFPVYDQVSGNGANATYRIVGFIELRLIGYAASGNSSSLTVQYVNYSPAGALSQSCGIGNPSCVSYNAYATRLLQN